MNHYDTDYDYFIKSRWCFNHVNSSSKVHNTEIYAVEIQSTWESMVSRSELAPKVVSTWGDENLVRFNATNVQVCLLSKTNSLLPESDYPWYILTDSWPSPATWNRSVVQLKVRRTNWIHNQNCSPKGSYPFQVLLHTRSALLHTRTVASIVSSTGLVFYGVLLSPLGWFSRIPAGRNRFYRIPCQEASRTRV